MCQDLNLTPEDHDRISVLQTKIRDLYLPRAIQVALEAMGIHMVWQACSTSEEELRSIFSKAGLDPDHHFTHLSNEINSHGLRIDERIVEQDYDALGI